MASISIGLIGLGRHGMRYARHLLQDVSQGRLVAVCRRRVAEGSEFGAEHQVRFHADYRDLIADSAVEAVVVVTPPSVTRSIGLEAVRARKPLLIEKPLALTGVDAREMVSAAHTCGVPLMAAQTLRYEAAVRALRAERPEVGEGWYMTLTSRVELRGQGAQDPVGYGGRGVLLEVGIHLLDLVRFLTGEEVVEVRCETDSPGPGEPEHKAWASLRTSGNFPCLVDVAWVGAGRVGRCEWVGGAGQILADWARHRLYRVSRDSRFEERDVKESATVVDTLQAFLEALEAGSPMPISGLDGQRAVEIADACYESAETGRIVRLAQQC